MPNHDHYVTIYETMPTLIHNVNYNRFDSNDINT